MLQAPATPFATPRANANDENAPVATPTVSLKTPSENSALRAGKPASARRGLGSARRALGDISNSQRQARGKAGPAQGQATAQKASRRRAPHVRAPEAAAGRLGGDPLMPAFEDALLFSGAAPPDLLGPEGLAAPALDLGADGGFGNDDDVFDDGFLDECLGDVPGL